jgi:predicted transcriptional regulator
MAGSGGVRIRVIPVTSQNHRLLITVHWWRETMSVVNARLPDELVRSIDETARSSNRTRTEIIRLAVEFYLASTAARDPDDSWMRTAAESVFDWEDVDRYLLARD